jgi:Uncharacterized conserved protein
MYEDALKQFEYISQAVGIPLDYTQGGGGNTSVKLSDELMAVKASGFKLKQITPKEGFVVVNYKNLKNYINSIDPSQNKDYEKDSNEFIKNNIVEMEGLKKLRPSVEAGFHAVLKKYVIHTHAVYANMVCCTHTGSEIVQKIFKNSDFTTAWIPYINPGFSLSLKINEAVEESLTKSGKSPDVIFMENHGLIVSSDDAVKCVELHDLVNAAIKEYLAIKGSYPSIDLFKIDDNTFISKTDYIARYFRENAITEDFFYNVALYPDQLVYLNGNISAGGMDKKMIINSKTGEIVYKTNYSEAQTMEETLLAYLYVVDGIKKSGLPLKTMSEKEIDFISNWESEKYRKSLAGTLQK